MVLTRILVLQLLLVPALTFLSFTPSSVKTFRALNIDYPKITFPPGFKGYCNGFMSYIRGWKKDWHCSTVHYILHAPWTKVRTSCKYADSFCEDFNEYCTISNEAFPLTICSRKTDEPSTACLYNETTSTQRIYLLCSRKFNAEPIYVIGLFKK